VVGIPSGVGEKLDEEEPGWKISGKYVSTSHYFTGTMTDVQAVVLLSEGRPGEAPQFA
jgi:hypothetical protein